MYEKIKRITSLTQSKLGFSDTKCPRVGIVLGSGLGELCDKVEEKRTLHYDQIEGMHVSTVAGHAGQFVAGKLCGVDVIIMQGRLHFYEGYTMQEVMLPTRVMCLMGIETLIVTNAAGGVNPDFEIGDVMLIGDHINMMPDPLVGRNIDEMGPRFVDMSETYSIAHRTVADKVALELGIPLRYGVYLASSGPTYETPAEYRLMHMLGADACGMSTTPEVIAASHAGVSVLGFSIITNIGNPKPGRKRVRNSHDDVVMAAREGSHNMIKLIEGWLTEYNK